MKIENRAIEKNGKCNITVELLNIKRLSPHYHRNGFELIYCLEGKLEIISAHRYRTLYTGEFFMVDQEEIHTINSDSDNVTMVIDIGFADDDPMLKEIEHCFYGCESRLVNPRYRAPLRKVADLMLAIGYEDFAGRREKEWETLCAELRDTILNDFNWIQVSNLSLEENEKYRDRLNGILKYVLTHYREKITLAQLSEMFYINENYLSKFLRKTSMRHLSLLVWFCRCYEAEQRLAFTDMPITRISDECGFSSQQYFYKYFRYFYKTTPLQYRKRMENLSAQEEEFERIPADEARSFLMEYMAERTVRLLMH